MLASAVVLVSLAAWHRAQRAAANGGRQDATPRVAWAPARPVQGTLFVVNVTPGDTTGVSAVHGTVAGEPLHFRRDSTGVFHAIAGIPIETTDSIALAVVVVHDGMKPSGSAPAHADSVDVHIPVASGSYPMEHLHVAPRFGRSPDSALAARLAREREQALAVSHRSHETPRQWHLPFVRPRGSRITSGFGGGREFNGTVESRHMGVDFAGARGAPVRVANDGIVALVAHFYLAGNAIYVDHGGGLVTAYFHLSRALVHEGDTVRRGQVIGHVGSTGRVTGPHLHWIARYGEITVNPMSLLAIDTLHVPASSP
ncbi:MAG TPA: M23 family metallopeptidase [Gemmatimonadaceae bacterium]|nr:M23 family metallopeptidase [Gemmatimonadaceae bacterium]